MSGRSLLLNFSQVISVEEDGSVRPEKWFLPFLQPSKEKRQERHLCHTCLPVCGRE